MNNTIEKLDLNKKTKILLLQVLKQGKITRDEADTLINFFVSNELIEQVSINFVNFNNDEK